MTYDRKRITFANRAAALGAVISMVLLLMCSLAFIADRADHDCCEDHCSVCEAIRQCAENLKTSAKGTEKTAAVYIIAAVLTAVILLSEQYCISETLISQKVRLDS